MAEYITKDDATYLIGVLKSKNYSIDEGRMVAPLVDRLAAYTKDSDSMPIDPVTKQPK